MGFHLTLNSVILFNILLIPFRVLKDLSRAYIPCLFLHCQTGSEDLVFEVEMSRSSFVGPDPDPSPLISGICWSRARA